MSNKIELIAAHKQALMTLASLQRAQVRLQLANLRGRSRVPIKVAAYVRLGLAIIRMWRKR